MARKHDRIICIRMPAELIEEISTLAIAQDRSDSAMIRWLLRCGIAEMERELDQHRGARRRKAKGSP